MKDYNSGADVATLVGEIGVPREFAVVTCQHIFTFN